MRARPLPPDREGSILALHPRPRTFAAYYGHGPLSGLEHFDLLILEPAGWPGGPPALPGAGAAPAVAYLSLLEATETTYREAGLGRADILARNGRPWYKPEWGTWVVDPRSVRWRAFLTDRVRTLAAGGWGGLFLDTVGDIEDETIGEQVPRLLPAVAELVHHVRVGLGEGLVIQNHGILLVLPLVAAELDAICWESPPVALVDREVWADVALQRVMTAALQHDLAVLLLGCAGSDAHGLEAVAALQGLAVRYGCLAYTAPGDYHLGLRLPDGRIVPAPTP